MKILSTRGNEVAEAIRDRVPFKTHGALSAKSVDGLTRWDCGAMSGPDLVQFDKDCEYITYVVYSYSTPIAWSTKRAGRKAEWYKVEQWFSRTTSAHQGRLYLIPGE